MPSGWKIPPELAARFAAKLPRRIGVVADALDEAIEDGGPAAWQTAEGALHQLAGTAGSYGFPDLDAALRDLLEAVRKRAPESELRARMAEISAMELTPQ